MRARRRITVAAPSVGPLGIAGCVLWLRADLGVTKDGSNKVSQWDDQSGNGHHAVQAAGGSQPVHSAKNGCAAVHFVDTSDYLATGAWARTGSETLFVVGSVDSVGGSHHTFCDGLTVNTRRLYENTPALTAYAGSVVADGNMASDTLAVARAVFDASGSVALNGTSTAGNTGTAAASGLILGAAGGPTSYLVGHVSEVCLYSRVLSASEIAHIEGYLGARYGISVV